MADVVVRRAGGEEFAVVRGQLWLQRAGNWLAHLEQIDATDAIAQDEAVTIVWQGAAYVGVVMRSAVVDGFGQGVVLGGRGGLTKQLDPKGYDNQLIVRCVTDDIARESGESFAATSTPALRAGLGSWLRLRGAAGDQLTALTDAIGMIWRMQADGTIWVGSDTWPATDVAWDHDVPQDGWHPQFGCLSVVPGSIGAVPGQRYSRSIGGVTIAGRIGSVVYSVGSSGPSARLYFVDERAPAACNLCEPLRQFVVETMRGVELLGTYVGKVVLQRADGTLDVEPDDKRLPSMTGVHVRVPVPGAKLTIPAGSRCQLVFEGADVQQRVATLYEPGADVKAVARVDDTVDVGTLVFSTVANGVLTGTYTPPGGVAIPFSLGSAINLRGKITSGSPHFSIPR